MTTTRQHNQTMPPPLVVLDDLTYCTGPAEHEARIITTGYMAYAATTGAYAVDVAVCREGATISGCCPGDVAGGPCPGTLTWGMDTEGAWTADAAAISLLTTYGTPVER